MYNFKEIEKKWQKYWLENETFKTDVWDFSKPKYYVLDMFPYPSGVGLHTGHASGYTATDVVARLKRMQGFNVLHPMGWDAFGLPAEQYAITTGNHPEGFTKKNIATFKQQLQTLGFSYDWTKELSTADPNFYKWTQWIFKQLYLDHLAKWIDMPVNWCEELGTVLSNDEIIDGKSERGGYPVIRKNMKQWVLDIPKYADKLLTSLDNIDWPESTKEMQRNWIGKSTGALVTFKVNDLDFDVFTTRPDTLYGATYCVLAPEHQLVEKITSAEKRAEVKAYQEQCLLKSELERTELNKDKTGVFIGAYAVNPVNKEEIPIYISDYVLASYGTGAIMAVPAHDERDYEFAKKFDIAIIPVIEGGNIEQEAYVGDGIHINSEFLNGLNKQEAIDKIIDWLEHQHLGKRQVNYRLREWIFARQRYWGEPVPIIHLEDGSMKVLEDDELPLVLPVMEDYKGKSGQAPLENATTWKNVVVENIKGTRETSTMPGAAGSSWYFLRYIDPNNNEELANQELLKHWLPVDLYVGGPEHAVGHLLYSRFWNNYLYDKGLVPVKEPFHKLVHQGMILGENGIKMGKRFPKYVVNPSDVINSHGADCLRLFEMFMGPIEADKPWNWNSLEGSKKFLDRVYRLFEEGKIVSENNLRLEKVYHQTVKKVTNDYETLNINTAISQLMIFINAVYKEDSLPQEYAEGFIKLLNPVCPHIAEEIWHKYLEHNTTLAYEKWPSYDEAKTVEAEYEMVVQVNGKVRGKIMVATTTSKEEMEQKALEIDNVNNHISDKKVVKIIVVPGKLVNIVVK